MSSNWDSFGRLIELDLFFKDVSNRSAGIYANGRNRIELKIAVQILDRNNNPLILTENDLKDQIYFCDYEDGRPLESKWTVSNTSNEYTQPIRLRNARSIESVNDISRNTVYISKFLSCTVRDSEKTFAVAIDVPGIGKFDTTKNGTNTRNGADDRSDNTFKSPSKLTISALPEILYTENDLIIVKAIERNKKQYKMVSTYDPADGKEYNVHYDNYYITVENGLKRVNIHEYGGEPNNRWISKFDSENHNPHIIVMHPFNTGKKTETFGFSKHKETWEIDLIFVHPLAWVEFNLSQEVTYNDRPNALCITHMYFGCGAEWKLPPWVKFHGFEFDTWFDLYDVYGNHGQFKPVFSDDKQLIEIRMK